MEFVSYEIAKKLKEKGYPQVEKNTLAMYDEDGYLSYLCPTFDINRCYYLFDDFDEDDCVCPTISQVLKWLRKEHKIYMYVERDTYHLKFRFVYEKDKPRGKFTSSVYDGFEQAALAGIEYVIDNLI